MSNPKEKAKELVDRYYWVFGDGYLGDQHIQCALIAVDEMLSNDGWSSSREEWARFKKYFEEVKQEIEKL